MTIERKVFAFKLAEKKPAKSKWKARDGVSLAGCTYIGDGRYWYGPMYNPDGEFEC